ncbi:MAG: adaptor protein MecA, partial [Monoglobales bacterium]
YDMQKWNVTYDNLSTDNPNTNDMFWDIILKVAEQTGIDLKNCKLTVEVVRTAGGNCILIITKKDSEEKCEEKSKEEESRGTAVYKFSDFDAITGFAKNNLCYCFLFNGKNTLYRYNDELILVVKITSEFKKYIEAFEDRISEYADIAKQPSLYCSYLEEHVKPILEKNALKTIYYKM